MSELLLGFVIGVLLMLGPVLGLDTNTYVAVVELVERGYGLYCPSDGNFAFIGECE
jgi:hypothetical protein